MKSFPRVLLASVMAAGLVAGASALGQGGAPLVPISVYKTPTCGCCAKWVTHLEQAGFKPTVQDLPSLAEIKQANKVPGGLQSCHTAVVGGYVVEGHVPADVIHQLLKEKPKVAGIAVPGMPIGSPGMEQGARKDPYNVIAFEAGGATRIYATR